MVLPSGGNLSRCVQSRAREDETYSAAGGRQLWFLILQTRYSPLSVGARFEYSVHAADSCIGVWLRAYRQAQGLPVGVHGLLTAWLGKGDHQRLDFMSALSICLLFSCYVSDCVSHCPA